uniref:Uncharacterized protein n=1 Tax=Setaria italica TaxID=4555 RepID=K3YC96_SETIT
MALVNSGDTDLRIYEPSFACEYSCRQERANHRSRLLAEIHNAYCKAFERLTINSKARCPLATRTLAAGFCFGLLDPASNIVINALVPCRRLNHASKKGRDKEHLEDMERRSLDGMVIFLTRFFPYLADSEAERYLLLADADLLVATRIIVMDRRMKRFGSSERATEEAFRMALKCAALAARHPDPDRLVGSWLTISNRLDEAVRLGAKVRRRSPSSSLHSLARLLDGPPWRPAEGTRRVPYQRTSTPLKRLLLDAIHGFYLQALARLPAGELRSRFHRSLLKAGHCYGPRARSRLQHNRQHRRYDAAFPRTHELELDMISSLSLHRIENRSLYGMASFLCTRYHRLDFHQAMRFLLDGDANLLLADPGLHAADAGSGTGRRGGWKHKTEAQAARPPKSSKQAFRAAAVAASAWHPNNPDAQLSSVDVRGLARLLSPEPSCSEQPLLPFPLEEYVCEHIRITKKLHVICGVNDQVTGPVFCPGGSKFAPHKCYQSHVNFLATLKDTPPHAREAPVLLFAELSNDDEDKGGMHSMCCTVSAPPPCADAQNVRVRCLYCDYVGIRIVHPIDEEFHGRELEFEKM